jgi:hypothetical protein
MHGAKRERILRVILDRPDGSLTKYRVAKESGCSIAWTITYLKKLQKMGLIDGTRVLDLGMLFDHWASIAGEPERYDFFIDSPTELLKGCGEEYALTTYLAENLTNHYLFPSRADVYICREDLPEWKRKIALKGLVGKGNVRLLIYDSHVFYKKMIIDGLWVASMPQIMLDLKREGGVCVEAYEMMVEKYVRHKGN